MLWEFENVNFRSYFLDTIYENFFGNVWLLFAQVYQILSERTAVLQLVDFKKLFSASIS